MTRRGSRISQALRGDPFADPEPLIRRVYAYAAYRIGPGSAAEDVTRDVFARAVESKAPERRPGIWLVDAARKEVDDRFAPLDRDRGFVALHMVGLDDVQVAELLGYRREAATVAVGRALLRLDAQPEPAEPAPEFVERLVTDVREARQPVSRSRRRALLVAIAALALLAAVPAFGALVAGGDRARDGATECERLAARLDVLPARHAEEQARLIRRFNREKQDFSREADRQLALDPESRELAAELQRQLNALEARHTRELEDSNERQNSELTRLEAQRTSCEG